MNEKIIIKGERVLDSYLKQFFDELNFGYSACVVVIQYGYTVFDMREQNLAMYWMGDSSTKPDDYDWRFDTDWDWYEGEQFIRVDKIFLLRDYPFGEPYLCYKTILYEGEEWYG